MTSPFLPSPFTYGDSPNGGQVMPTVISARVPSNTIDKLYPAGYYWLCALDQFIVNASGARVYGNGNLYYQAGNSSGLPNWVLMGSNGTFTALTASSGDITATSGNLVLSGAASKLLINSTTTATSSVGTTPAMIVGETTITSSAITTSSKIIFSRRTAGGTTGDVAISAQSAGSAVLTSSSATETSTFDYLIIN